MKHLYIVGRPSTTDLMRNAFPHNNPFAHVIVTTSLQEALQASQILTPDQSPFEDTLNHLGMPQAMVIYHAQTEIGPPVINAEPGKTQNAYGTIFTHLQIKDIDIMIGEDALHPAEAKKDTAVASACLEMHSNLWNRTRRLEEYTQALNTYTNTPPEALLVWYQSVAAAEQGKAWHVPSNALDSFVAFYHQSPFDNVLKSAQYATAKTAAALNEWPKTGMQQHVLCKLEDNAMLTLKDLGKLYGNPEPASRYEAQILQHAMPIIQRLNSVDRPDFVKTVQFNAEISEGYSPEKIFQMACRDFEAEHPEYKGKLDDLIMDIADSLRSEVPMMVYGYAEGWLQQKYGVQLNSAAQDSFNQNIHAVNGYSEMQRIGAALDIIMREQGIDDAPTGMYIAQSFTQAHLTMGLYANVCFAWVPDDIRPAAEATYTAQSARENSTLSMVYALASSMTQCNQAHNSALMMRDISTILNEVTMQAVRAGVSPVDVSELMNDAFENTQDDIGDNFEEHN